MSAIPDYFDQENNFKAIIDTQELSPGTLRCITEYRNALSNEPFTDICKAGMRPSLKGRAYYFDDLDEHLYYFACKFISELFPFRDNPIVNENCKEGYNDEIVYLLDRMITYHHTLGFTLSKE
jgi:hypothetical protein